MAIYYINLLWILALAVPLCMYKPSAVKKAVYIALTLGALWFLATFREGIGFDYHTYLQYADDIAHMGTLRELWAVPFEFGFTLLMKLLSFFTYRNPAAMYGVVSALTLLPVGWFIYRYCETAWLSVWLYVTLTFFYTSMNFIRQTLACSILLLGYGFLRDKKPVKFFAVVALAALFHKSALLMIPIYFLCHIRLNKVMAVIYGVGTLVGYLFSVQILNFVTNFVFQEYKGTMYLDPSAGFSPIFLMIPVSVLAGCLALWPAWRKRYPEADMLLNMMIYSAIIWLFITKHFIVERFSHPMYIMVLVALPQAISCLKKPKEDEERLVELRAADKKKGNKTKAEVAAIKTLSQDISDHKKYWASAAVAVVLLTGIYHEFGQQVNGFHNIFPYHSYIGWLDAPGDPMVPQEVEQPDGSSQIISAPVPQKHVYPAE